VAGLSPSSHRNLVPRNRSQLGVSQLSCILPSRASLLGNDRLLSATEGARPLTSPVVPSIVLARITSAAVLGIDAYLVDVETDIAGGLPSFVTVGLPQGAVKEGRERVNAAIHNAGFEFPLKRITVNLAPAQRATARRHQRAARGGS
jgi:hypothetical protein